MQLNGDILWFLIKSINASSITLCFSPGQWYCCQMSNVTQSVIPTHVFRVFQLPVKIKYVKENLKKRESRFLCLQLFANRLLSAWHRAVSEELALGVRCYYDTVIPDGQATQKKTSTVFKVFSCCWVGQHHCHPMEEYRGMSQVYAENIRLCRTISTNGTDDCLSLWW